MSLYNLKTIRSGDIIEVYEYEKPIALGKAVGLGQKRSQSTLKTYLSQKKYTFNKAKNNIRRLINSNVNKYQKQGFRPYPPVFLTLTYKENKQNRKEALIDFKNFVKRLNYVVYQTKQNELKYVAVSEYQKRGSVHFHFVAFNLPYYDSNKIASCWGKGFIKVNQVRKVRQVGAYISKYFSKTTFDLLAKSEKMFFCSKKLFRSIIKVYQIGVSFVKTSIYEKYLKHFELFTTKYDTEYNGLCCYWQFCVPF